MYIANIMHFSSTFMLFTEDVGLEMSLGECPVGNARVGEISYTLPNFKMAEPMLAI